MVLTKSEFKEKLKDRYWRLTSWLIYKIKDKEWNIIPFKPNPQQLDFLKNIHYRNIILKARQQGFSTMIDLFLLDAVLFKSNTRAKIVAQSENVAMEIFEDKIKIPFENLPEFIRENITVTKNNVLWMAFSNWSQITVSTSWRWSSNQLVHISEFWPICYENPMKAAEIIDGTLKTVPKNWFIAIESTAKWRWGKFYDMYWRAKHFEEQAWRLTEMDYKAHFYPWHIEPTYSIEDWREVITDDQKSYFKEVESRTWKTLTIEQQNWYIKEKRNSENMFAEHPSYAEEAFMDSHDWVWYRKWMKDLRLEKRIWSNIYDPNLDCHTYWDIWMHDWTTIIIVQFFWKEIRIIDEIYWEWEWLEYYVNEVNRKPYTYVTHTAPHDIVVTEWWWSESRISTARKMGIRFDVWGKPAIIEWINAVRRIFHRFIIDEAKCPKLIEALDNYSKEWDNKHWVFKDKPNHNEFSHFADSVRLLGLTIKKRDKPKNNRITKKVTKRSALTWQIM